MIELNRTYNEDCRDTMKRMDDNYVNMILTSPMYDALREYKGARFDFELDFKPIAKECYRVLMPGGVMVWVVGDQTINGSESLTSFKQALYFKKECGFKIHDIMIYKKNNFPFPESNRYYQQFEYMFILCKGKITTTNLIKDKLSKNPGSKVARVERQVNGNLLKTHGASKDKHIGLLGVRGNVWEYSTGKGHISLDNGAYTHPAIFPEKLARDHIYTWSNFNDIVYDPFAGSGTTPKMCILMNRRWIASEIAKEYCDIIEQRIKGY